MSEAAAEVARALDSMWGVGVASIRYDLENATLELLLVADRSAATSAPKSVTLVGVTSFEMDRRDADAWEWNEVVDLLVLPARSGFTVQLTVSEAAEIRIVCSGIQIA